VNIAVLNYLTIENITKIKVYAYPLTKTGAQSIVTTKCKIYFIGINKDLEITWY